MVLEDTSPRDILNIPRYSCYRAVTRRLEREEHYTRKGIRGLDDSIRDLIDGGFQVARIQHFDDHSHHLVPGQVTIYARLLAK
jgi:hypothetical protein